jgi:RHS repeat-associated protein
VGFRPGHTFESGSFGENIDTLNGGLNLSVPIGQSYVITPRLQYALKMAYNSKVWDTSDYNNPQVPLDYQVVPTQRSPFGLGFTMNLGRLFKDPSYAASFTEYTADNPNHTESWVWVSPDGSQHQFFNGSHATDPPVITPGVSHPGPVFAGVMTNDNSYYQISGLGGISYCPAGLGLPGGEKCISVKSPDGIVYTLVKRMDCTNPPDPPSSLYGKRRAENQSFCGWYTALIEDRTVGAADATTGFYPHYVKVTYDNRTNFTHSIARIEDSVGRVITFHNCEWASGANPLPSQDILDKCISGSRDTDPGGGTYAATDRNAVATYSIEVPAFGNDATVLQPNSRGVYKFWYEYQPLNRGNIDNQALMSEASLKLVRMDYPGYTLPGQSSPDLYSLYFGYAAVSDGYCGLATSGGDFGEVTCRTLPVRRSANGTSQITGNPCGSGGTFAFFNYRYNVYQYFAATLSGGHGSSKQCSQPSGTCAVSGPTLVPTGMTRQVAKKTVAVPDGAGSATGTWSYCRNIVYGQTNPTKAVVTDPFNNDTVYRYYASPSGGGAAVEPEDGVAPEWNDGLNYSIEVYEGSEATGRRIRTTTQEYDADHSTDSQLQDQRAKENTRVRHEIVRHDDDGGREAVTFRNGWNGYGEWSSESFSGFDLPVTKHVERQFSTILTANLFVANLVTVNEVSDGFHALSRSDMTYGSTGRLLTQVDRAVMPPIGAPPLATQYPGDVKTTYTYSQASGNVITKQITASATDPGYTLRYTWAPAIGPCVTQAATLGEAASVCGGYLATKTFLNNGVAGWKSIDRDRDANTGLIKTTRDTSGVATTYTYDPLGRVGTITPTGEETTNVVWTSLTRTTVTQGTGTNMLSTLYDYDGLGRKIAVAKRSYDPVGKGVSCQTTKYEIDSKVKFESDPWFTTGTCAPGAAGETGTAYRFTDSESSTAVDALGRVRRVIPSDGNAGTGVNVTKTDYFGTSSRVTVNNLNGGNGVTFPSVTTFYHDAQDRLIYVDSPSESRCSQSASICSLSSQCPAGESCVATNGGADAIYGYDALDRMTRVDLTQGPIVAQSRAFEFDGLGRLKVASNPENGTTTHADYDALGNPTKWLDAAGNVHRSIYDFAGRLLENRITPVGQSEALVAQYIYDEDPLGNGHSAGKVTTIKSYENGLLNLTESRTYDGLGLRLSKMVQTPANTSQSVTTEFDYDTRGQLSLLQYPIEGGATRTRLGVNYAYLNGYLVSATQAGTPTVLGQATYNPAGAIAELTTPGGGKTEMTFDSRNRPRHLTIGQYSGSAFTRVDLEAGDYQYDGAGNIYQIGPTTPDPLKPWLHTNRYGYDAANRLIYARTEAPEGSGLNIYLENFVYDALGNMTQRQIATTTTSTVTETEDFTMGVPNRNRILTRKTTFSTSPGVNPANVNFTYDINGNLIEGGRLWWPTNSVSMQNIQRYDYDEQNRLLKVHLMGNQGAGTGLTQLGRYAYDVGGNRIWKEESDGQMRTHYVRDTGGQVLSEFRRMYASPGVLGEVGTLGWAKDYVYFGGRLLAMRENIRPEPPVGLRATQVKQLNKWIVTAWWNQNTDPDRQTYTVYRFRVGVDSSYQSIGTVAAGSNAQVSLTDSFFFGAGTTVSYKITCTDTGGETSDFSTIVTILTGDQTKPSTPVLSGVAGDGRVTLSYSSTDNVGVVGYNIYRGTTVGTQTQINTSIVTTSTYVDLNLLNGTTYYYRVQSVDTSGNLSLLSCQGGTCPLTAVPKDFSPPSPPHGVAVCDSPVTSGSITISWLPNPDTDMVVLYEVYRSSTPDFSGAITPIHTGSETMYEDAGLSVGSYYYAVKAVDSSVPANKSAFSAVESAVSRPSGTAPTQRLFSQSKDGEVTVTWARLATEPTKYFLYRKLNASPACFERVGEINPAQTPNGQNEHSFQDLGMANDVAYDYVITSVTGGVESGFSSKTLGIPLTRTSGFSQCGGNEDSGWGSATMTFWNLPTGARPYQPLSATAADGTLGFLKGYHVYHYRVANNDWNPASCSGLWDTPCADDSLIRSVIQDINDPLDKYRIRWTQTSIWPDYYHWRDQYYPVYYTTGSEPAGTATVVSPSLPSRQNLFLDADGIERNCVMPKAVYKVYAEGTWLTVESDWPDYFDPLQLYPNARCGDTLKFPFELPSCGTTGGGAYDVPAVTNLTAATAGPGSVRLTWTKATAPAGAPPIAGYYLYAWKNNAANSTPIDLEFQRPLPFATLSADATEVTISNLARKEDGVPFSSYATRYRFRLVSFNTAGSVSSGTGVTPNLQLAAETDQPGVPRSLRNIVWTINDLDPIRPKTRKGVKISWEPAKTTSGWAGIQGYRVYRSTSPGGPYCALLHNAPSGAAPLPSIPNMTVCLDANLPAGDYSAGPTAASFWDRTVAQGQPYYYRVTQLELDNSVPAVIRETPFLDSQQVAGEELPYRVNVLPPPQGLKAFAPLSGADMKGVYVRWCPIPTPDPADTMPAVSEYRLYKEYEGVDQHRLFAKLSPSCVAMDALGNYTNRCVITNANACVDASGYSQACSPIAPSGSCTGADCGVVDLTYTCWPAPKLELEDQHDFDYSYVVTAMGTDPASESVNSNVDHAWLNYCATEFNSCAYAGGCSVRRDPDTSSPEAPVCGGEQVRLIPLQDVEPQNDEPQMASSNQLSGVASDYRIIGQGADIPAQFEFYHLDHLGSPRVIMGITAQVVSTHHYLPFGDERPTGVDPTLNTKAFTGHERDAETGMDYMLARYYSSSLGRFMAVDPGDDTALEDPQSWNKYAYVRNNPLRAMDPDGESAMDFVDGVVNAFSSDMLAGGGRVTLDNSDYASGQVLGDAAALAVGAVETVLGAGGEVGGLALDATGAGAALGVPVGAVSTGAVMQGVAAVGTATTNLVKASESPGQTYNGHPTDKYGNKLGGSGEARAKVQGHGNSPKAAKDAARADGNKGSKPIKDPAHSEGVTKPHYHPTDAQGNRKPGATHHTYTPK